MDVREYMAELQSQRECLSEELAAWLHQRYTPTQLSANPGQHLTC